MYYYHAEVRIRAGKGLYAVDKHSKYFDTPEEAYRAGESFCDDAKGDFGSNYRGCTLAIFDNKDSLVNMLGKI